MFDLTGCLLSILIFGAIFAPLELLLPRRRRPWPDRETLLDGAFLVGNFLLWTPLVGMELFAVHRAIAALPLHDWWSAVQAWPAAAQIAAAILVSDCCTYWFHRLSHRSALLWRFHRVHHSAERLDWVAAYREHPVDNLLTRLVENLPIMLFGLPLAWIAGIAAFRGLWALFIHSNIGWTPPRWLAALIGSPRLHQWHHEPAIGAHANFANLSPLMDIAFGTWVHPDADPGTLGDPQQPRRGYLGHLAASFAWPSRT